MAWVYKVGVQTQYAYQSDEQKNNAVELYNYFTYLGATIESICGMLGNITKESGLNPGCKQRSATTSGWGLIQWTPSTVLTNWASRVHVNWYDGAAQCERIQSEGMGQVEDVYWIPTQAYPYTWSEFLALTDTEEATKAYLYERERAGIADLQTRITYANYWYSYLTGQPTPPTPPTPTPPTPYRRDKKMPVYMMLCKKELTIERRM